MAHPTRLPALLTLAGLLTSGCRPSPVLRGEFPAGAETVTVSDLRAHPDRYAGKSVEFTGRLSRVCQHVGCWFYLTDERAEVYVDLEGGARFVVPTDSKGRRGRVAGTVRVENGEPRVIARGVELR